MSNPLEAIAATFAQHKPVFMPYFTLGYPTYEQSLDIVVACATAGAHMMELGIPFSDPLADGPTIQHSAQVALAKGMSVAKCLTAVTDLRARGVTIPFLLMGYINPILAYGIPQFVADAATAGANGFIIPDLPPEEGGDLAAACAQHNMALVYLLSPNSSDERIATVAGQSTGFTYLVSVTGITGTRTALSDNLAPFIARVRAKTNTPLAVGFGISTAAQVRTVGEMADGVIVGSALIKAARDSEGDRVTAVAELVRGLTSGG